MIARGVRGHRFKEKKRSNKKQKKAPAAGCGGPAQRESRPTSRRVGPGGLGKVNPWPGHHRPEAHPDCTQTPQLLQQQLYRIRLAVEHGSSTVKKNEGVPDLWPGFGGLGPPKHVPRTMGGG